MQVFITIILIGLVGFVGIFFGGAAAMLISGGIQDIRKGDTPSGVATLGVGVCLALVVLGGLGAALVALL